MVTSPVARPASVAAAVSMPNELVERYTRRVPKGAVLFREGEPGDCMYVVQTGRVLVVKQLDDAQVTLAQLGPGDSVGEMAVLDRQPRSADAVVAEDSTLLVLDRGTFEQMVRENGEVAVRIMRKLSQRLREANRQIQSFMTANGALRAIELLRVLAGPQAGEGPRTLPAGTSQETLTARAGLSQLDARAVWERLAAAGLLTEADGAARLAPDADVDDYLQYVDLKQRYDPLTTAELAEMTGLSEEEVHDVARRVILSRLEQGGPGLADSYQRFLKLKSRFEYERS